MLKRGRSFVLTSLLVFSILFLGVRVVAAFSGPTSSPGVGGGAVQHDGNTGNIGIGTSPVGGTKLLIQTASVPTTTVLDVRNSNSTPIFTVTAQSGAPTSTTKIDGNLIVTGTINGIIAGTTIAADNVSQGTFGQNTGGGNYAFPASLGVGTSTGITLPQGLSVYNNLYVT